MPVLLEYVFNVYRRRGVVTDEYRTQMQPADKYNNAPVPPLVVVQPGLDTLNKPYNFEVNTEVPPVNSYILIQFIFYTE